MIALVPSSLISKVSCLPFSMWGPQDLWGCTQLHLVEPGFDRENCYIELGQFNQVCKPFVLEQGPPCGSLCCFRCSACFLMDFLVCCSGALPLLVLLILAIWIVRWHPAIFEPCKGSSWSSVTLTSQRSHSTRRNSFVCIPFWILICAQLRIGEAKVPGPTQSIWTIGTCNPAGLPHKAHLIGHSQVDLWLVSETHLSFQGYQGFRNQLRAMHSAYQWMVPGSHVQPRSTTSDHGSWSGVAALSCHPTRRLPVPWSLGAFDTSRIVATTTYIADLWLSGCVVYGVPTGPTHPRAKLVTDSLLNEAIMHLSKMTGPRYLAGDFNHDLDDLPCIGTLKAMNFVEVQDLHFQLTGVNPQPTSKRKVRRDFLFISAELIPFFRGVQIDHDSWIDHATIVAEFSGDQHDLVRFPWPKPSPLPWDLVNPQIQDQCQLPNFETAEDCSVAYREFWASVENQIDTSCKAAGYSLQHASRGRASILQPKVVRGNCAPLRASRSGEVLPKFFGISFIHKHWFRQLRRIQSYLHLAKGLHISPSRTEHQAQLWGAICRAPGFAPNFVEWWPTRPLIVHNQVFVFDHPPSFDQAEAIFAELQHQVRNLEKQLNKRLPQVHGAPTLSRLYKAVKRDAPAQVDVLFQSKQAKIERINHDDSSIVVDPAQDWHEDKPFLVNGIQLQPIVVTHDQLWIQDLQHLEVGQTVVQPIPQGRLDIVFDQFIQYWRKFWCKHVDVPLSQWEQVLSFARSRIRPVDAQNPHFDEGLVRASAKAKKNQAAVGLDGVSKNDIVNLSTRQLRSLTGIYLRAGCKGEWPIQLLEGVVKSLAKKEDPQDVPDYRPITVFSLLYRLWSTIASKFWLKAIDCNLDPMLCGNRNQYQAATLWRKVMEAVENAQLQHSTLSGLVIDLTKAYNTLPRLPCLGIALASGVDQFTLQAWASALSGMRRRFWVNGSVSSPVTSNRGFPEGCGMSCLSMLLLTQVWHDWIRCGSELHLPLSFVDNWEVICNSAEEVKKAFDRTLEFASSLDISVDKAKTFSWAVQAGDRRTLRRENISVVHDCRDLGAHAVFSLQVRNSTVIGRFQALDQFWDRLHFAKAPFDQKVRVIKTAAWPRALHAIAGSLIGRKHFHNLRCQACKALGYSKPGCNRFVLAHLCQFDPQFQAIVQTVRDWQNLGNGKHQAEMLTQMQCVSVDIGKGSLTNVFIQRLQTVGWKVEQHDLLRDHHGCCVSLKGNWIDLQQRLQEAWSLVVASQVHTRPTFRHFQLVNLDDTRHLLKLGSFEQGILRNIMSGVMLTREHSYHWSEHGALLCELCGKHDSLGHRFWDCPETHSFRMMIPSDVVAIVHELPTILTWHGWSITSSFLQQWYRTLDEISDQIPATPDIEQGTIDLFTDGSCLWPCYKEFRVASWSVVQAGKPHIDSSAFDSKILGVGHLPGRCQSAFRAELYALVVALTWISEWQQPARIWIDCQGVIDRFTLLTRGGRTRLLSTANGDLWEQVRGLMLGISCSVQLIKVDAHMPWDSETPTLTKWARIHNACADRAAGVANQQRSNEFWAVWNKHSTQVLQLNFIAREIRLIHQLRVCNWWTDTIGTKYDPQQFVPRPPRQGRVFSFVWNGAGRIDEAPVAMVAMFGSNFTDKLIHWWNNILDEGAVPDRWISFAQLYVSFQQDERHPGVCKVGKKWCDPDIMPMILPEQLAFRKRCRYFRLALQQLWKFCKFEIGVATTRPSSSVLACHIGCTSIPVKVQRFTFLDDWIRQNIAGTIKGLGQDLDKIPAAW